MARKRLNLIANSVATARSSVTRRILVPTAFLLGFHANPSFAADCQEVVTPPASGKSPTPINPASQTSSHKQIRPRGRYWPEALLLQDRNARYCAFLLLMNMREGLTRQPQSQLGDVDVSDLLSSQKRPLISPSLLSPTRLENPVQNEFLWADLFDGVGFDVFLYPKNSAC